MIGPSLNSLVAGTIVASVIFSFFPAAGEPQNDIVETRIGNARFSIPRAFVTHWLPNARAGANLAVEFGYPGSEPLGLMRFSGDPVKWTRYVRALREKGTDRIFLEISAAKPKPAFDRQRASRFMESACRLLGGNPEEFQELSVEFIRCTGKEGDLALIGYSNEHDLSFRLEKNSDSWRLWYFDLNDGVRFAIDIPGRESLRNWKAIFDATNSMIAMWKK